MSGSTLEKDLDVQAVRVAFTDQNLVVELKDGRTLSVPLTWYPRLFHGTALERSNVEIGVWGLHWPDLNEDISIEGLLRGKRSGESAKSIQRWLDYRARGEKEPIPTLPLPPEIERELKEMGIDTTSPE